MRHVLAACIEVLLNTPWKRGFYLFLFSRSPGAIIAIFPSLGTQTTEKLQTEQCNTAHAVFNAMFICFNFG